MLRLMLKSKIHNATITEAVLWYEGSLTLDPVLMRAADVLPNEWVLVVNLNTGSRLETYLIEGEEGSGTVCLNGAAARLGAPGDQVIVLCYAMMDETEARAHKPLKVKVDAKNRPVGSVK